MQRAGMDTNLVVGEVPKAIKVCARSASACEHLTRNNLWLPHTGIDLTNNVTAARRTAGLWLAGRARARAETGKEGRYGC
mmetsp:Transcript_13325/g.18640  ORF Transcript_13325/g.18640 Transcript_13325/m.18640 type:complete len:80 (+) Transcript_13325:256-495(+)